MTTPDVAVIGSGASAVAAAWALARAGRSVRMLDVGVDAPPDAPLVPMADWARIRRTDPHQHRFLLGDSFEGIPIGAARVGSQVTPPRRFVTRDAPTLLPRTADGFVGLESVALGGLAAAWGAAISPWGPLDFEGLPISLPDLVPHYDAIADLIGVCGDAGDDLSPLMHDPPGMMPPLDADPASSALLARYRDHRADLNRRGLRLGRARLAACSRVHRGRGPHPHLDLDFWCDHGDAVYRPRSTLRELLALPNFEYVPGVLVRTLHPDTSGVRISLRRLSDDTTEDTRAARVILAAGALGSARIALRSLGAFSTPVPLVSNTSTYHALLNLPAVGAPQHERRHSLTQLTGLFSPPEGGPEMQLQVYSYRSLLTFKLLREQPLAFPEGKSVLRALLPILSLVGMHHEDRPSPDKLCELRTLGGSDSLYIRYHTSPREDADQLTAESRVRALFRSLSCLALRRVHLGHGASIHYAGTLAMSDRPGPLNSAPDGAIAGLPGVFAADSSVFPRLPARGVTFTMMANAHRVASLLAASIP
ncbi:MAG: GMC oxidoreductase [Phycisphaerales bacterium]